MPEQPSFPPEVLAVLGEIYTVTSPRQGATSQVWIVECTLGERVVKYAPDPRYDLALALLPHEDGDLSDAEVAAFYAAYGCDPLTQAEYHYFTNLYEFF